MTWRLATSFVLTAEMRPSTAESGEDAMLAVGVSRHERVGLVQRIRRQIDERYSSLLPSRKGGITAEEITELTSIFGENGEMAAERLS